MCKKLINLQNTKTQKQTNLSIFCKSNDELNNISQGIDYACNDIFQGIHYACNNIPVIWGVGAV